MSVTILRGLALAAGARCALAIQDELRRIDGATGLPSDMGMRLSIHFAPVFEGWDWIARNRTFFGVNVTKAARIEPIAPAGEVYATEAMAAELALLNTDDVAADYVGIVPLAKDCGAFRMYALRHGPARLATLG